MFRNPPGAGVDVVNEAIKAKISAFASVVRVLGGGRV